MAAERRRNNNFSPQAFVDDLLKEGSKVSCDESNRNFYESDQLPSFFDEELYKKGQNFFHKHLYSMFFCKFGGLITILSVPTILKMLKMTNMSGTEMTAYRRYMSTIFHMMIWYDDDFKPGSRLWKSLSEVRRMHNSASKKGCLSGINRISQADMALTQFGFMGFALARSRKFGFYNTTEEEWSAFLHVWRVIGKLMGIEDRFNLCDGTVTQTRQICNILIQQVFKPHMEYRDKDFIQMTRNLCNGLSYMFPLQYETMLTYFYGVVVLSDDNGTVEPIYFVLNLWQNFLFIVLINLWYMFRYNWFRVYENYTVYFILWMMKYIPLLAIFRFGFHDSFNLCDGTVTETRQICNILIQQVFKPHMEYRDKDFIQMTRYLCNGLSYMLPLQYETMLTYFYGVMVLSDDNGTVEPIYFVLNLWQNFLFIVLINFWYMFRYNWFRVYKNYTIYFILWMMKYIPLLAIFRFGFHDSYVNIKVCKRLSIKK